jgi:hypothetical protein
MLKATRKGESVSLTYRGVNLTLIWPCDTMWLATDKNGDVWAYEAKPVHSNILGSGWDCAVETSYETPVYYFYAEVSDWADSLEKINL